MTGEVASVSRTILRPLAAGILPAMKGGNPISAVGIQPACTIVVDMVNSGHQYRRYLRVQVFKERSRRALGSYLGHSLTDD